MAKTETLKSSYKKLKDNFNLLSDEPMKKHTSIQVGGPADLFAMPETKDELVNLIKTAQKENITLTIIGDGTNLLVTDKGIRGLVISTSKFKHTIGLEKIDSAFFLLKCLSGTKLSSLCNFAIKNSLKGLEFAAGIPGTVGGAVAMNAGTPTGSMSEIVNSIELVSDIGKIFILEKEDLNFSYRKLSNINGTIINVSFLLKAGDAANIQNIFKQNLNNKKLTQPLSLKSAGCIFKNPENGEPAGKLIDIAGLKGKKVGDAVISDKHANFICNLGKAKCEDILKLKQLIEKKIAKLFSVELKTEIIITGEEK